jgi:hypothetical protein
MHSRDLFLSKGFINIPSQLSFWLNISQHDYILTALALSKEKRPLPTGFTPSEEGVCTSVQNKSATAKKHVSSRLLALHL